MRMSGCRTEMMLVGSGEDDKAPGTRRWETE